MPEPDPTPVQEEPLPSSTMGSALSFPSQLGDENVDGLLYDPGKSTTPQLSLPANLVFGDGFVTDLPGQLFPYLLNIDLRRMENPSAVNTEFFIELFHRSTSERADAVDVVRTTVHVLPGFLERYVPAAAGSR